MEAADFQNMLRRDRESSAITLHEWMTEWEWAKAYHRYNGPEDLLRWMEWTSKNPQIFFGDGSWLDENQRLAESRNRAIVGAIFPGQEYQYQQLDQTTALDYAFVNALPQPPRRKIQRILDFGAGFGRQVNLWWQKNPGLSFTGMDGIETAYCLQNLYYGFFTSRVHEYATDPDRFQIAADEGIYHVPTWRHDLLPSGFYDLITCVQVLAEINETLVKHMLEVFARVLKPGGALYLRDHENRWQPAHKLNVDAILSEMGFRLEFRPDWVDARHDPRVEQGMQPDVHGIPRIWRKPE
jgi:SAM-dependent methyltransferase